MFRNRDTGRAKAAGVVCSDDERTSASPCAHVFEEGDASLNDWVRHGDRQVCLREAVLDGGENTASRRHT